MTFPPFEPSPKDVIWVIDMINILEDNGVLYYPNTGLHYRVRKEIRVFELLNPDILNERIDAAETHWRTGLVLEKIDWKLIP